MLGRVPGARPSKKGDEISVTQENGWTHEYVVRVWHRGYADFAWEVRQVGDSTSFASGAETSETVARASARRAVDSREARVNAKWQPLRRTA